MSMGFKRLFGAHFALLSFGVLAISVSDADAHVAPFDPGVDPGTVQSASATLPGGQQAQVIGQAECEQTATAGETCSGGAFYIRTASPLASGTQVSYSVQLSNGQTRTGTATVSASGAIIGAIGATAARGGLEVITSQATRQATNLQETPIATTAITPVQIEQRFVDDIRGLADLAPNVTIENVTGFNAAAIGIRGTGTNDIITSIDSAVGVVVDEFALVHTQGQLLDPFDVENVEILRGPQGTLFGKNTTGGVVLVRTVKPVHNEFTGKFQFRAGNHGTLEGRAAVNIPLIEDKLSARFVTTYQYDHGQYTNDKIHPFYGVDGSDTPLGLPVNGDGRNLGGTDVFYGRAKFLLTPSDNYEALLTIEMLRDRSPSPPAVNETPLDGQLDKFGIPREFLFNPIGFPGFQQTCPGGLDAKQSCIFSTGVSFRDDGLRMERGHRMEVFGIYLNQQLDLDEIIIDLILGYRHQKERLPSTYTGEAFPSLFDATRNLERDQFQAELRFTSNFDSRFNFIAGAAYFQNNLDWRAMSYVGFTNVPINLGGCDIVNPVGDPNCFVINGTANDRPNFAPLFQDADAIGIYTEMYYNITDKLTLTFGARYSYEKKKFGKWNGASLTPEEVQFFTMTGGNRELEEMLIQGATPMNPGRFNFVVDSRDSWDNITFKAVLDYEIDDYSFVYFSFNQGFKSGSFVETCTSVGTCEPFDEESADSFELGYKGDFFDNTVRLNVAAFYTKINNVVRSQVVRIINQFGDPDQETQFRNIAGQESYGLEVELTWLVTDNFMVNMNGSYLHSKYTEFITDVDGGAGSTTMPECIDVDETGNDDATCLGITPNFAPKWQFGADFVYEHSLGNSGTLVWNGSIHWMPEYEYSVFNSDFTQVQERTLINTSLTWVDPEDRFQISIFAKNLLNETYRVSANSVAGLWNFSQYGQDRRWGGEINFNF